METPVLFSPLSSSSFSYSSALASTKILSCSNHNLGRLPSVTPKRYRRIVNIYGHSLLRNHRNLIFTSSCHAFHLKRHSRHLSIQATNTSSSEVVKSDILYDIYPFVRVYKDGSIERFMGTERVPASLDPTTGVESKDIKIAPERNVSARVYVRNRHAIPFGRKLPLLIYFHGGGFVTESAFSPTYHTFLNALVAEANIIAVSIEYSLAPEHLLPIAYEDSWLALNWVVSHYEGNGNEMWLNKHVDFGNVYLGGDSAGANIVHNMAMRVGLASPEYPIKFSGAFLNCPYFLGKRPIGNEAADAVKINLLQSLWIHSYPNSTGLDDPLVNPAMDPKLSRLGCTRMLIFVAEEDLLRDRGWYYFESLSNSGWKGNADVVEVEGEDHVFNLNDPTSPKAIAVLKRIAAFLGA